MDCSVLLGEQLARIEALVDRLKASPPKAVQKALFRELCDRAALHIHAREHILMPVIRRAGWRGVCSETLVAHVEFKRRLADLVVQTEEGPRFLEALQALEEAVERQMVEDEIGFVPTLRAVTDLSERRALCHDMELMYQRMSSYEAPWRDTGMESPWASLREEAAIVLSSLSPTDSVENTSGKPGLD